MAESVLTSSRIDRTTVAGICAYKGGKLVYFLSMEGKKAFVEAAGKSISIKVGSKLHYFLVKDISKARLLVTYMVMGFSLSTTEEEITLIGKALAGNGKEETFSSFKVITSDKIAMS